MSAQLERWRQGEIPRLKGLKTENGYRTIDLHPSLVSLFRERRKDALAIGLHRDDCFVFFTDDGRPLLHRNTGRDIEAAANRANPNGEGQRPVSAHMLRHTFASRLIALGLDVVEVARQLGDKPDTLLRIYAKAFQNARRRDEIRQRIVEGTCLAPKSHDSHAEAPKTGPLLCSNRNLGETWEKQPIRAHSRKAMPGKWLHCWPRGRSSVGRASASQAEGRGFEPHRPLQCSCGFARRSLQLRIPLVPRPCPQTGEETNSSLAMNPPGSAPLVGGPQAASADGVRCSWRSSDPLGFAYLRWPATYRRGIFLRTSVAVRSLSEDQYATFMRILAMLLIVSGVALLLYGAF
jgi:integrase-like protein